MALPCAGGVTRVTDVAAPPLSASEIVLLVLLAATVELLFADAGGASARVTLMLYPRVVPSCALTTTEIVLLPAFSAMACEAEPEATDEPLTVTVAWLSFTTGVTVTDETSNATVAL